MYNVHHADLPPPLDSGPGTSSDPDLLVSALRCNETLYVAGRSTRPVARGEGIEGVLKLPLSKFLCSVIWKLPVGLCSLFVTCCISKC